MYKKLLLSLLLLIGLQSTPARAIDFDELFTLSTKVVFSVAALTAIAYYYIFHGNEGSVNK